MALILNIETSSKVCSVALSDGEKIVHIVESTDINDHSASLTVFIEQIIKKTGIPFKAIDAIAVSKGPGSYTGLRIGVSAAKGICYGSNKPLIGISTLQALVSGLLLQNEVQELIEKNQKVNLCPMIDARRMEVYTALYDADGCKLQDIKAEVLSEDSFSNQLSNNLIIFFGNGADKFNNIIQHPNAIFIDGIEPSARYISQLSHKAFLANQFEDIAYFEPFYLKDFVATTPKKVF